MKTVKCFKTARATISAINHTYVTDKTLTGKDIEAFCERSIGCHFDEEDFEKVVLS